MTGTVVLVLLRDASSVVAYVRDAGSTDQAAHAVLEKLSISDLRRVESVHVAPLDLMQTIDVDELDVLTPRGGTAQ